MAMYSSEKRSKRKTLGFSDLQSNKPFAHRSHAIGTHAGAKLSNPTMNATSHRMVYTILTGDSIAVNSKGNRLT